MSDKEDEKPKKLILDAAVIIPSVLNIMSDIQIATAYEAHRLAKKAKFNEDLKPAEIKSLEGLTKVVKELNAEQRRIEQDSMIKKLSDAELLTVLQGLLAEDEELKLTFLAQLLEANNEEKGEDKDG